MITKILYSKSVAATINYVMNPAKRAEVSLSKGISSHFDKDHIIRNFELQSSLHPSLQIKVLHIPTSFHVQDTEILEEHSTEILQDWLDRMESHGYHFDQFFYGRHHDKDDKNPHFHLVANVVLNDGSRANLANIGKAAREASIYVTEKWGLTSAKHLRDEMMREQNEIMKEYLKEDYISSIGYSSEHRSSDNSTDTSIEENSSEPIIVPIEIDAVGVLKSMLLGETMPVVSSGGGGGNNEDDEEKKKRHKSKHNKIQR